jgi:sulfite exporter TauE/SafE
VSRLGVIMQAIGKAVGIDADDVQVLAAIVVAILLVALVVILLAGAAGLAVGLFERLASI